VDVGVVLQDYQKGSRCKKCDGERMTPISIQYPGKDRE
jgi:hypothetical protein